MLSVVLHFIAIHSLYLMLVSILPLDFPLLPVILSMLMICAACCISLGERKLFRLAISAILASAPVILFPGLASFVFILPPSLYFLFLMFTDRLETEAWEFRNHALWSMPVEAMFFLLAKGSVRNGDYSMAFALLAFVCGVCFLRLNRLGVAILRDRMIDIGATALIPVSAALLLLMLSVFFGAFKQVFRALLTPFIVLYGLFVAALSAVFHDPGPQETIPDVTVPNPSFDPETELLPSFEETVIIEHDPPDILPYILVIILVAVIGILVYLAVKTVLSSSRSAASSNLHGDVTAFVPESPNKRQADQNRKRVRRVYKKYLNLLVKLGYARRQKDTSVEILERTIAFTEGEAAARLREIYILARYDTGAIVTNDDVKEAKQLLSELKRSRE